MPFQQYRLKPDSTIPTELRVPRGILGLCNRGLLPHLLDDPEKESVTGLEPMGQQVQAVSQRQTGTV